jgi:hypothetical protein
VGEGAGEKRLLVVDLQEQLARSDNFLLPLMLQV